MICCLCFGVVELVVTLGAMVFGLAHFLLKAFGK